MQGCGGLLLELGLWRLASLYSQRMGKFQNPCENNLKEKYSSSSYVELLSDRMNSKFDIYLRSYSWNSRPFLKYIVSILALKVTISG